MSFKWVPPSSRPVIMGNHYMVSTGHYLASVAATRILDMGGNAADAGVAAGLCLNVTQPDLTSIGGVAPIAFYQAGTRDTFTVSGLGPWPRDVDLDSLRAEGRIPTGIRRSVVPSAMGAWLTALERFGSMPLAEVFAPAIELAANGFRVHSVMRESFADPAVIDELRSYRSNAAIFLDADGHPLALGDLCVQKDLARTLEKLVEAAAGAPSREAGIAAARDRFYRGDIARTMIEFSDAHGGWLSLEDLDAFEPEVERALCTEYQGYEVYACGPWCQGPVVLQSLNILEGYDLAGMGLASVDYYHVILESLKAAFADRDRYYGDPRFVDVPLDGLLSKEYAAAWRDRIDPATATPGMPEPGDAWAFSDADHPGEDGYRTPNPQAGPRDPDTSYLCIVDSYGNAFSATPSDGARETPVVPGLGFIISSRGVQSWLDPDHPASIRPGKRPRLTPNPGIVVKDGEFVMPYGTPGADVQPQAMIQFLVGTLDQGLDIQQAIETPRAATYSFPGTHDPHVYTPGVVKLEARAGNEVVEGLGARGHDIHVWPEWTGVAGSLGAVKAKTNGSYFGAADPRRVAYALGW